MPINEAIINAEKALGIGYLKNHESRTLNLRERDRGLDFGIGRQCYDKPKFREHRRKRNLDLKRGKLQYRRNG